MTALLTDSLVNVAAEEMICKLFPDDERWAGTSPEYHRKGFIKGAFYARSIYEARLAEREAEIEETTQKYHAAIARELRTIGREQEVRAGLVEALQDLLAYAESQICSHEETHRGGAIWEICDICGDCWADDDGGKPPRQDPEEIVATRSALLAAAKVLE